MTTSTLWKSLAQCRLDHGRLPACCRISTWCCRSVTTGSRLKVAFPAAGCWEARSPGLLHCRNFADLDLARGEVLTQSNGRHRPRPHKQRFPPASVTPMVVPRMLSQAGQRIAHGRVDLRLPISIGLRPCSCHAAQNIRAGRIRRRLNERGIPNNQIPDRTRGRFAPHFDRRSRYPGEGFCTRRAPLAWSVHENCSAPPIGGRNNRDSLEAQCLTFPARRHPTMRR
jgi:hypothetical protein